MNLLPISLAFILVFYYFCASSWKDLKATLEINQASHDFFEAQRNFFNKKQRYFYKKPKDPSKKEEKKAKPKVLKKTKAQEAFVYHREKSPPRCSTAKLNLDWLINKPANDPLVMLVDKIALTLIRDLYKDSSFYYEGLENKILTFIKETAKKHPNLSALEEIFALYSENDPAIYKAFKGTAECELKSHAGYPSLLDFISLKKGNSPIHFYSAHAQVLTAAFGVNVFEKIKTQEFLKWKTEGKKILHDNELKLLLSQFVDKDVLEVLKLIEFSDSITDKAPIKEPEPKP